MVPYRLVLVLAGFQIVALICAIRAGWFRFVPVFCVYLGLAAAGNADYALNVQHWIWLSAFLTAARAAVSYEVLWIVIPEHAGRVAFTLLVLTVGLIIAIWTIDPQSQWYIARSLVRMAEIGEGAWMWGSLAVLWATHRWNPGRWSWHAFCWCAYLCGFTVIALIGRFWGDFHGLWFTLNQAATFAASVCTLGWISISSAPWISPIPRG